MGVSRRGLLAAGLAALALPGCGGGGATQAAPDRKVEVFSWWAGPGEKEGLEALVADFARHNPGVAFDNAAVAGGAGTIARTDADRSKYTGYLAAAVAEWADAGTRVVGSLPTGSSRTPSGTPRSTPRWPRSCWTRTPPSSPARSRPGTTEPDVWNLSRFDRPRCAAARSH